jgi:UDPglucose 6-dehydrogenase
MAEQAREINHIAVFGAGYVGMSLAILLAQKYHVTIFDTNAEKISKIERNESPIKDDLIQEYLISKDLNLSASSPSPDLYRTIDLFIIATPTDYDVKTNSFDTSSVESVISEILQNNSNSNAPIVIKSTVPVGFTASLNKKFSSSRIVFSPEFLREGAALIDNLHPSRIIVGGDAHHLGLVSGILNDSSNATNTPIKHMDSDSAEAVKLFANTFLAMRVSFFNELDSFAIDKNLSALSIIDGVCLDPRIGNYYNNPSFGYGGYCLPKDTKQLLANYKDVPQNLMQAIVDANMTRQNFIADQILRKQPAVIGVYKLAMKEGSDNFRSSSILGVITALKERNQKLIIYEPGLNSESFEGINVCDDLQKFKSDSTIILANRGCKELFDVLDKVYTRDLFNKD